MNPSKSKSKIPVKIETVDDDFIEYEDDEEQPRLVPEIDEAVDARGKAINVNPPYDKM